MKSLFAIATLVVSVLAQPLEPPPGAQIFNLITKSKNAKLNDQKLSVSRDGKIGVYPRAKAAIFWSSQYTASKTLSFHVTDPTHQISLRGSKGVLGLVDVVEPNTDKVPKGQLMEWSTFVVGKGGRVSINDGADIPSRKWVAYQDGTGFHVAMYDGYTPNPGVTFEDVELLAATPS